MMIQTNDMVITKDTIFHQVYLYFPRNKNQGSDLTLHGNGAVLMGGNVKGSGIYSTNGDNIIIKNISLQRFYLGIHWDNNNNLTISNCNIKATHELPANTIFLDISIPANLAYGGGNLLQNVQGGQILDYDLSH